MFLGFGIIREEPSTTSSFATSIPIAQLIPGQWYTIQVEPMAFWRSRLAVLQPSYYQMNLTVVSEDGVSRTKNLAIFGREGQSPTITNYDWVHMVTENGQAKTIDRSAGSLSQSQSFSQANLVLVEKVNKTVLNSIYERYTNKH